MSIGDHNKVTNVEEVPGAGGWVKKLLNKKQKYKYLIICKIFYRIFVGRGRGENTARLLFHQTMNFRIWHSLLTIALFFSSAARSEEESNLVQAWFGKNLNIEQVYPHVT